MPSQWLTEVFSLSGHLCRRSSGTDYFTIIREPLTDFTTLTYTTELSVSSVTRKSVVAAGLPPSVSVPAEMAAFTSLTVSIAPQNYAPCPCHRAHFLKGSDWRIWRASNS